MSLSIPGAVSIRAATVYAAPHVAPIAKGVCRRCFIPAHVSQIALTIYHHSLSFGVVIESTVLLMVVLDYIFHDVSDKS